MSKGIAISHQTDQEVLDSLQGTRLLQVATPLDRGHGYQLRNYDDIITSVEVEGTGVVINYDNKSFHCRSAVLTYEESGLKGIAEFNEKDTGRTD